MDRRTFLVSAINAIGSTFGTRELGAAKTSVKGRLAVRANVDPGRTLGTTPADFLGFGYEISSVAKTGLLSARNRKYVQLVRNLGPNGVIRIGGNTSDYSSFAPGQSAASTPKSTVVNTANLQDLGSFLHATGWKLIWGLNLGGGSEQEAVEEAQAVAAALTDKLLALEIGNEPDLFGHGQAHRQTSYSYPDYLQEYRRYKTAIRNKVPNAPFAGPDVASATDWVTRFAADEGNDLKLLTHHYYRECANPASTLAKLLHPDPKLAPELETLRAASASSHVPYRICETNSFCGGGKPGISDTFGAALWVLDYMFTLSCNDAAGVNIETGVNQLGFISSYSPIQEDEDGDYWAAPEYYGMLAFAKGGQGQRVALDHDAKGVNLTAYAVLANQQRLCITIINNDESLDAEVSIAAQQKFTAGYAIRLTGESLESKERVTLGGSRVDMNGVWKPARSEPLKFANGKCGIHLPAASAAVLVLES